MNLDFGAAAYRVVALGKLQADLSSKLNSQNRHVMMDFFSLPTVYITQMLCHAALHDLQMWMQIGKCRGLAM